MFIRKAYITITLFDMVLFSANECAGWILDVPNSGNICTGSTSQLACNVSCLPGYYFIENPNVTHITLTCKTGPVWDRDPPVCGKE